LIEASNGFEALKALEQNGGAVDLVVSDVVMPEMDGPNLLKAIRGRNPEFKFLLISGYPEDAFEKNLPEKENFAFLPKPFALGQLITAIKETMSLS
jgi:two-component system cell cycle sensor histidine kinase/response regulator CckA